MFDPDPGFGGDPGKITLAGQDAGGVSALTLLSLVEGRAGQELAEKVILQSAGIQHPWSFVEPTEAFRRTLKLATLLGCPASGTSRAEVLFLRPTK